MSIFTSLCGTILRVRFAEAGTHLLPNFSACSQFLDSAIPVIERPHGCLSFSGFLRERGRGGRKGGGRGWGGGGEQYRLLGTCTELPVVRDVSQSTREFFGWIASQTKPVLWTSTVNGKYTRVVVMEMGREKGWGPRGRGSTNTEVLWAALPFPRCPQAGHQSIQRCLQRTPSPFRGRG